MMPRRIFSRRIPLFNNVAMLILCIVFFLVPFALRGARLAITEMKNNVADWLPKDYQETVDLAEFRKYFVGDQFVVISGPWCKDGNPSYASLKRKIYEESVEYEAVLRQSNKPEDQDRLRAIRLGDELGLLYTGRFHEDWGFHRERWLQGNKGRWYWINREGELWRWKGQSNIVEGVTRSMQRVIHGRNDPEAEGEYVDRFGPQPDDVRGIENPFYNNPLLLCARPFKSVTSGPEILEKMAGPGGTLILGKRSSDGQSAFDAKVEAHRRLTGALFGPIPPRRFNWSFESLLKYVEDVGERNLSLTLSSSPVYREQFNLYLAHEIKTNYENDPTRFAAATEAERLTLWFRLWSAMDLEPPPRQTCLVVTINEPFLDELDRIVGRPLMGKPRGRILEIATGEVGLDKENVHLGGPPSDNVAIDEEGTNSLLRLASLSGLIGVLLAYYSFRSFGVTFMMFFIGGMSAIASLSFVWFGRSQLDAILMTMPSLIYVLAISGAVHLVNYYRDACHEHGHKRAVDIAVAHGWFPCFLAAFTTSLGLISLCTSTLAPIYKFGLFSAIGTMATLVFLYSFLPAALTIWPPGWRKQDHSNAGVIAAQRSSFERRFWTSTADHVIRFNGLVTIGGILLIIGMAVGLTKITTTVQLLKLFDPQAKILHDYRWMEDNLGKLVPMEIVVNVDKRSQREQSNPELGVVQPTPNANQVSSLDQTGPEKTTTEPNNVDSESMFAGPANASTESQNVVAAIVRPRRVELQYSMLERIELSNRIRVALERYFGPDGLDIVGSGMSTDVFIPLQNITTQLETESAGDYRRIFNYQLEEQRELMLSEDYMAITNLNATSDIDADNVYLKDPNYDQREMWRISLRLAALNDVDYGQFVNDLKMVVEPIVKAYEIRTQLLRSLLERDGAKPLEKSRILLLGRNPLEANTPLQTPVTNGPLQTELLVDQTRLFSATLIDLLQNRGIEVLARPSLVRWLDPHRFNAENPFPAEEAWSNVLKKSDAVVMVEDHDLFNASFIRQHAPIVVDARTHRFARNPEKVPFSFNATATDRKIDGEDLDITATYTGIVPIVYKAQRALLGSLIESIVMSFIMISIVMMILLRDWREKVTLTNFINPWAGLIVMLPNVLPIVLVFGAMGFLGIPVDIGSMMTASVALGIAVDDTIHFLNWYRQGLDEGYNRRSSIHKAYERCAPAMMQTTLIAGLGLSVFALSTFAPTQRFGVLMLVLLVVALLGDLILLPAILSSPLGKLFGKTRERLDKENEDLGESEEVPRTIPLQSIDNTTMTDGLGDVAKTRPQRRGRPL